MAHLDTNLMQ